MGDLYLIRHGQASFANNNYDVLSPLGCQQATLVAAHLLDSDVIFDRVYCGTLSRQQKTADAYVNLIKQKRNKALAIQVNEGFNEFEAEKIIQHYLPFIVQKSPELQKLLSQPNGFKQHFNKYFLPIMNAWMVEDHPNDSIETWKSFKLRVNETLNSVLSTCQKGECVGVFTSGGIIATIMQMALQTPDAVVFQLNYKIANASVSRLFFKNGQLALSYFNNFSHLRKNREDALSDLSDYVTFK